MVDGSARISITQVQASGGTPLKMVGLKLLPQSVSYVKPKFNCLKEADELSHCLFITARGRKVRMKKEDSSRVGFFGNLVLLYSDKS